MKQRKVCLSGLRPMAVALAMTTLMPMAVLSVSCTERESGVGAGKTSVVANSAGNISLRETRNIPQLLEEITELERSGLYQRGMGFVESELKEEAGDYGGAVAAAYKEMARLYGFGEVQLEDIARGLDRTVALKEEGERESAGRTALALRAFMEKQWDEAEKMLTEIFTDIEDPDDFINWVLLSCALEKNPDNRIASSAYRAIRSRYAQFPEYWHRGARIFNGFIASDYAENCINLAPEGPFALECRKILALASGLRAEDGAALRSKSEIERHIILSVNTGNPELIEPLFPLLALPENPYTLYAIGALKAIASLPLFRDYFDNIAANSSGRLADRLAYISRG